MQTLEDISNQATVALGLYEQENRENGIQERYTGEVLGALLANHRLGDE